MLNFSFKMMSIFLMFILMASTDSMAQKNALSPLDATMVKRHTDLQDRESAYMIRITSQLRAGVHPDSIYENGLLTALTLAVEYAMKTYADFVGWSGIIEDLLEAGADPNKVSGYGFTPLMVAVNGYAGYDFESTVIITLLEWGADPDLPFRGGSTPRVEIMNHINADGEVIAAMFRVRDSELIAPPSVDFPVPEEVVVQD